MQNFRSCLASSAPIDFRINLWLSSIHFVAKGPCQRTLHMAVYVQSKSNFLAPSAQRFFPLHELKRRRDFFRYASLNRDVTAKVIISIITFEREFQRLQCSKGNLLEFSVLFANLYTTTPAPRG